MSREEANLCDDGTDAEHHENLRSRALTRRPVGAVRLCWRRSRMLGDSRCLNATGLLSVALCMPAGAIALSAEVRWIDVERSTVTLHVSASGGDASAIVEAPLAEGTVEDTETPHLALVIDVSGLRVVDPGRTTEERQALRRNCSGPTGSTRSDTPASRITH